MLGGKVEDAKSAAIKFAFALLPYLIVSWLGAIIIGGSLWLTFAALLAIRLAVPVPYTRS